MNMGRYSITLTIFTGLLMLVLYEQVSADHDGEDFMIACGPVSCDQRYYYCNKGFIDPECSRCSGICSKRRIGNSASAARNCAQRCPVFWEKQLAASLTTTTTPFSRPASPAVAAAVIDSAIGETDDTHEDHHDHHDNSSFSHASVTLVILCSVILVVVVAAVVTTIIFKRKKRTSSRRHIVNRRDYNGHVMRRETSLMLTDSAAGSIETVISPQTTALQRVSNNQSNGHITGTHRTSPQSPNRIAHRTSPQSHNMIAHRTSPHTQNRMAHQTTPPPQNSIAHRTPPPPQKSIAHRTSPQPQNSIAHQTSEHSQYVTANLSIGPPRDQTGPSQLHLAETTKHSSFINNSHNMHNAQLCDQDSSTWPRKAGSTRTGVPPIDDPNGENAQKSLALATSRYPSSNTNHSDTDTSSTVIARDIDNMEECTHPKLLQNQGYPPSPDTREIESGESLAEVYNFIIDEHENPHGQDLLPSQDTGYRTSLNNNQ